jgi:hypothetical protein
MTTVHRNKRTYALSFHRSVLARRSVGLSLFIHRKQNGTLGRSAETKGTSFGSDVVDTSVNLLLQSNQTANDGFERSIGAE